MGYEYLIRCRPADHPDWHAFLDRLENPRSGDGWSAFTTAVRDDGIYFCDNGRSAAAALALREIIDQALTSAGAVSVEEL